MRKVISEISWPKNWRGLPGAEKALLIADIWVLPRSRLRLKLLVFQTNRDMCDFYEKGMQMPKGALGRRCLGFVNKLSNEHMVFKKGEQPKTFRKVDRRYFAVMCLVQSALCMEVVTHESVHAAYAYAERSPHLWPNCDNPEERICYPAGRIAKRVNEAIHEAGLYPKHLIRS